jgi:hypothetical protein
MTIIELPNPDTHWSRLISKYLQLGTIPYDEIETQRLAHWAKENLNHNGERYHRNTSGVLQWCVPAEKGKALLLDIHEGVCGHHASK